jgi:hypothetical protein
VTRAVRLLEAKCHAWSVVLGRLSQPAHDFHQTFVLYDRYILYTLWLTRITLKDIYLLIKQQNNLIHESNETSTKQLSAPKTGYVDARCNYDK